MPNIRSAKKHIINCWHAGKGGAAILRDGLEHFIGKHKAAVKDHSSALIKMRMQHARAKTVAQREDQHRPFVAGQLLAADDGFGIGDQVSDG